MSRGRRAHAIKPSRERAKPTRDDVLAAKEPPPPTSTEMARVRLTSTRIADDMQARRKLTRTRVLTKLEEFLDAKKTVFFAKDGEVTETYHVPDYSTQTWAWDKAITLRGEYPTKTLNVNAAVMHVEALGPALERLEAALAAGDLRDHELKKLAGLDDAVVDAEVTPAASDDDAS